MSSPLKSALSRRTFMRNLGRASVAAASVPAFAAVTVAGAGSKAAARAERTCREPGRHVGRNRLSQHERKSAGAGAGRAGGDGDDGVHEERYHGDVVQRR